MLKFLKKTKSPYLLQELLDQIEALTALNPSSINTVRCLSYIDNSGHAQVVGATLRIGVGTGVVDNASSGGIFCGLDINRKCLHAYALNKKGDLFTSHPNSLIEFRGYEIPDLEYFDPAFVDGALVEATVVVEARFVPYRDLNVWQLGQKLSCHV